MRKLLLLCTLILSVVTFAAFAQEDEGETVTVSGQEITILPLSVVTESEPLVFDVTDTTAKVNFVSTVPLACYLIYGTDTSFGGVTNDPNMAQAAIINHNPVMFDLEPDTEYVFRMQGARVSLRHDGGGLPRRELCLSAARDRIQGGEQGAAHQLQYNSDWYAVERGRYSAAG